MQHDNCSYAFCYPVMTEHREKYNLEEKEIGILEEAEK